MSFFGDVSFRVRSIVRPSRMDRELDEELEFHLDMEAEKYVRRGMSRGEARRRALLAFGGVGRYREEARDARGTRWLEDLGRDLRYGARTLRRSPGFATMAVITLALGIGASTALFSVASGLLLEPLRVANPEELLEITAVRDLGGGSFSFAELQQLRAGARTLDAVPAAVTSRVTFGDDEYGEEVLGAFVTPDYFSTLGVRPERGRLFVPAAADASGEGVVLSHGLWTSRFGADPGIVGEHVRLNGTTVPVIGVAPASFTGTSITTAPKLWAALSLHDRVVPDGRVSSRMSFSLSVIARVKSGTRPAAVASEVERLWPGINEAAGSPMPLKGIEVRPLSRIPSRYEAPVRDFLLLMGFATALLLVIATVNVAGLLLARGANRQQEIGIRLGLGAGRGRVVRQLLTEGMLICSLAAGAGLLLATIFMRLLLAFRWPSPLTVDIAMDERAVLFGLGISVGAGLAAVLLPALRSAGRDLTPALHRGSRFGPVGVRARTVLVGAQVAFSVLLLVGAMLFLRSLEQAAAIEPGFDPENVWVASLDMHRQGYPEARGRALYEEAIGRARALPGVHSATVATGVPLGPGGEILRVEPVGGAEDDQPSMVRATIADPEYFATMQIPLLRGRSFSSGDRPGAPRVAVVSESFAHQFWPGQDPIGKRFRQSFSALEMFTGGREGEAKEFEIVGLASDGRYRSLHQEPEPHVFIPLAQDYRARAVLAVRTVDDRSVGGVRSAIREADPALPLLALTPLDHLIADVLLPQRVGALLTTLFGALALLLTAMGIYGVVAYAVTQRTREIGVRIALGAEPLVVQGEMLRRALLPVVAGGALGLAAAFALTRLMESLLFEVSSRDPVAFGTAAGVIAATALAASWVPGRRATRVDPSLALRAE